jgi:hypothetical protein
MMKVTSALVFAGMAGVLAGSLAAPASGAGETGTLTMVMDPVFGGQSPPQGNGLGGGELRVTDFVGLTIPPCPAAAEAGSTFQTFCLEHNEIIGGNPKNWAISEAAHNGGFDGVNTHGAFLINGVWTDPICPETAYLYTRFWNRDLPYKYTDAGGGRKWSAATLQIAFWILENEYVENAQNLADAGGLVEMARADVNDATKWPFGPNSIGDVRVLTLTDPTTGENRQDVLVLINGDPPPPPGDSVGHTPGFWSNKNGCAKMKEFPECVEALVQLNLVKEDGTPFDPTSIKQVTNWINKTDATNMASKLSSHLAAMFLNICVGFVDADSLVYTGTHASFFGGDTTIKIGDVVNLANAELALHPNTPTGSPYRAYQAALKDILDDANNNLNWVP